MNNDARSQREKKQECNLKEYIYIYIYNDKELWWLAN